MVITLTPQNIQNVIDKSDKIIIDAFASWCPHCARMKPIFEKLEKELGTKYVFAEFDIDEAKDLASQLSVESLPTFIFIKNKKEVGRIIGEIPENNLKKAIGENL
ncbi:thioredoxin family protein [Candidatus Dependentiae bacterium]|nr:thioredoxin family protein [Candidatus Dependentiae bacterium]